jgi:hypothetical protein
MNMKSKKTLFPAKPGPWFIYQRDNILKKKRIKRRNLENAKRKGSSLHLGNGKIPKRQKNTA